MKTLYTNYLNTFKGLSKEVWWLALITFINRSGTMVIPFLSLYLKESLKLSLESIGWIMVCFGFGSILGSWLGGKLSIQFGFYKIMTISLIGTGISFYLLQFANTYLSFSVSIFVLMVIADMFRPAMYTAINAYSSEENKTRSITLIRLAINLGFSAGPFVGGIIITFLNYKGLFWIDAITCVLAGLLLLKVLHPKKVTVLDKHEIEKPKSAWSDKTFLIFLISMVLFSIVFFQYFSVMPLYWKGVHGLSEFKIGLLMGMNGLVIFVFEMPLVKWLETNKNNTLSIIIIGGILTALSFVVILAFSWIGVVIIGMLLLTFGEMIAFPFSNKFAIQRAKKGKHEQYMALFTISFSIAHVISHKFGIDLVVKYGFNTTWTIITATMILCVLVLIRVAQLVKKEALT
jgi:predicted MFS family arabinose efflux permease